MIKRIISNFSKTDFSLRLFSWAIMSSSLPITHNTAYWKPFKPYQNDLENIFTLWYTRIWFTIRAPHIFFLSYLLGFRHWKSSRSGVGTELNECRWLQIPKEIFTVRSQRIKKPYSTQPLMSNALASANKNGVHDLQTHEKLSSSTKIFISLMQYKYHQVHTICWFTLEIIGTAVCCKLS
jgi:hypothetical protein